jgi:hypothetical protein
MYGEGGGWKTNRKLESLPVCILEVTPGGGGTSRPVCILEVTPGGGHKENFNLGKLDPDGSDYEDEVDTPPPPLGPRRGSGSDTEADDSSYSPSVDSMPELHIRDGEESSTFSGSLEGGGAKSMVNGAIPKP